MVIPFPPLFAKTKVINHPSLPKLRDLLGQGLIIAETSQVTDKLEQVGHRG